VRSLRFAAGGVLLVALITLPDADLFWRSNGIYLAGPLLWTLVLVYGFAHRNRTGPPEPLRPPISLLLAGFLLSVLFWLRARAGMPGIVLADVLWWSATLLSAGVASQSLLLLWQWSLRRQVSSNVRSHVAMHGIAFLIGLIACLAAMGIAARAEPWNFARAASQPGTFEFLLLRPTADPRLLNQLPVVDRLRVVPEGMVFHKEPASAWRARGLEISGRTFGFVRRNLDHPSYALQVRALDPERVRVNRNDAGYWQVSPKAIGPAVVKVSMGRARSYLGLWGFEHARHRPAPKPVTSSFRIEVGAASLKSNADNSYMRRRVDFEWRGNQPIAGPLFAVFRLPAGERIKGSHSVRTDPAGGQFALRLPAVGATTAVGRRTPVYAPGETIALDITLSPGMDVEGLRHRLEVVQAFDMP
jgi:hypothetical protein